jgi:hypothetical protein
MLKLLVSVIFLNMNDGIVVAMLLLQPMLKLELMLQLQLMLLSFLTYVEAIGVCYFLKHE